MCNWVSPPQAIQRVMSMPVRKLKFETKACVANWFISDESKGRDHVSTLMPTFFQPFILRIIVYLLGCYGNRLNYFRGQ